MGKSLFSTKFRFKKNKDILLFPDKIYEIQMLFHSGKTTKALEEIQKLEKKRGLTKADKNECKSYHASFLLDLGKLIEALPVAREAYEESLKLKKIELIIETAITYSFGIYYKGKAEEFIQIVDKASELFLSLKGVNQTKYDLIKARLRHVQGMKAHELGHNDLSLEYTKECYLISKKYGWNVYLESATNNLGTILFLQSEYDLAMKYFQEKKVFSEKLGSEWKKVVTAGNIASLHRIKGDYDMAFQLYKKPLKYYEEQGNISSSAFTLGVLMDLSIEMGLMDKAKLYFQRLKDLGEKEDDEDVERHYKFYKALFLKKTSKRLIDKVEAQKIFRELSEKEHVYYGTTFDSMLHLSDLLLEELTFYGNEEVLIEIEEIVKKLKEISEHRGSHPAIIESLIIEARLALLRMKTKQAQELLNRAQKLAEEKDLRKLAIKVSKEHDELLNQSQKMGKIVGRKSSFTEKLELVQLDKLLEKMIKRRAEEIEAIPEEPVLLILLCESGLTIYSHDFVKKKVVDEQLIGGFISAITAFCAETFDSTGFLERIKHQEFTILLNRLEPFIFAYVIRGESYLALQKLEKFVESIKSTDELFTEMKAISKSGYVSFNHDLVKTIITEIF